jgi:hypothetical protein
MDLVHILAPYFFMGQYNVISLSGCRSSGGLFLAFHLSHVESVEQRTQTYYTLRVKRTELIDGKEM